MPSGAEGSATAGIETAPEIPGLLICGIPRSGTSLTRGLIGSHPAFAVPRREMAWWVTLYPRYRRRARSWQRFLNDLLDAETTQTLELDREAVERRLRTLASGSHIRAFALLLSAYAQKRNRHRWGEKTPLAEVYAHDVLTTLPNVKVIHLMRDPRDVFASYLHAPFLKSAGGLRSSASVFLRGHLAWTMRNWLTSVHLARANAARHPKRYYVLRYEDLVGDPALELERVCTFLGEPFDRGMLEMKAYPDVLAHGGNSSFERLDGVSRAPVGRFRSVLLPRAVALCEALAGAELERQGYVPSGVSLGASENLRLYGFDVPQAAFISLVHAGVFRAQGIPR